MHRHYHRRHEDQPGARGPRPSKWALLGLLCVAQLMVILDISAVNVALPDLSRDLSIAPGDVSWTITNYSLISAVCRCWEDGLPICSVAAAFSSSG